MNERLRLTWFAAIVTAWLGAACEPLRDDQAEDSDALDVRERDEDEQLNEDPSELAGSGGSSGPDSAGNGASSGSAGSGGSAAGSGASAATGDGSRDCAERVPSSALVVGGDPATGTTSWSGAVHVTKSIKFRGGGSKLTIAPGTQIFVDPDVLIELGWAGTENTIEALGTEAKPIKFCRSNKTAGNWQGLTLRQSVLSSSALSYVVIEGAGKDSAALVVDAGILLDHVWVRDSASTGVAATNFRGGSKDLSVTTSAGAPLVLGHAWAVERLPQGGTFTGNGDDVAHATFDRIGVATRFRAIGIPYLLEQGFMQDAGGDLTVDAGVELRVGIDQQLELGWAGSEAEVQIEGTADKPVVIRGAEVRAGSWLGVSVRPAVFATSSIKHVQILHGGGADGSALAVSSPITISDITFKDNAHEAFFIDSQGLAPDSARFTVSNTVGHAGRIAANALTTLPAGGSFRGNQNDYVVVEGGRLSNSGAIPEIDVPLRVLGSVQVTNNAALTIAAGAEFHMQNGVVWDIGWAGGEASLTAVGSADKPIKFRGINEQPGFWSGIAIRPGAAATSRLEHVQIGHGGGDTALGANLQLRAPITVTSCKLYGSARYGLTAPSEYEQPYETLNTFEDNAMGPVLRD